MEEKKITVTEKTKPIFEYLGENYGENLTAQDIAEALGIPKKSVDGAVTAGLQRKGLSQRVPAEIELDDGTKKNVKFISLTAEGKALYDSADY